jgi:ribosome recycling factor
MATKKVFQETEEKMKKAMESLKKELGNIRTGRATPAMLERVSVDYYGTPTPVNQVANVSIPEPRMLVIQPWEKNMLSVLEKAILKSDLGITPNNDGSVIRLSVPQLTQQRRTELVKMTKKSAEEAKVAVRNLRRDANESLKKLEKDKTISEDDNKRAQEEMQKLTDKYVKEVDRISEVKEKEIMEV